MTEKHRHKPVFPNDGPLGQCECGRYYLRDLEGKAKIVPIPKLEEFDEDS